jgi:hypothetical protein
LVPGEGGRGGERVWEGKFTKGKMIHIETVPGMGGGSIKENGERGKFM